MMTLFNVTILNTDQQFQKQISYLLLLGKLVHFKSRTASFNRIGPIRTERRITMLMNCSYRPFVQFLRKPCVYWTSSKTASQGPPDTFYSTFCDEILQPRQWEVNIGVQINYIQSGELK